LWKDIETGRLVVVVMTRLVLLLVLWVDRQLFPVQRKVSALDQKLKIAMPAKFYRSDDVGKHRYELLLRDGLAVDDMRAIKEPFE